MGSKFVGTYDGIHPDQAHTLAGLFRERIRRTPEAVAYRQFNAERGSWEDATWQDMGRRVAQWQAAFVREGLQPGDRVAVMLRNCREWVVFDQAAMGCGLVTVPLYTDDRPDNVAYILEDAGVRLLLIEGQEHWQRLQEVHDKLEFLQRILSLHAIAGDSDPRLQRVDDWTDPDATELLERDRAPDELATIVYTSGTTGRSKGVMLSHNNILSNAWAGQETMACYREDVFLSFLPLSHTLERTAGYYLPMMCGSLVAYNRSIPELAEDLTIIRPTVLISVPRIFERVYNKIQVQLQEKSPIARKLFETAVDVGWRHFEYRQGRASWSPVFLMHPLLHALVGRKVMDKLGGRMRVAVSGGAPLSPSIARLFIGLGLTLVQGYGLTETSPVISVNREDDNIPASVGVVLNGIEVRIGDQDELLVRGPNVMLGYWNNPEATAAMIDADGWLHTGDKARIENSHIFITGRLKEILVLSNGEKVPPADMEMAIAMDPLFEQVMVVGDGRPYLTALLVLNPEQWRAEAPRLGLDPDDPAALADERLKQAVLDRITDRLKAFPGYARICDVACFLEPWTVDNGLITPTLKLRRERILARYQDIVAKMYQGH